jgi:membrane protein
MMIMHRIIKQFEEGKPPLTSSEIAVGLGIPSRLTNQLINLLIDCNLVSETYDKEKNESGFQPARAISTISIQYIVDTLDHHGMDDIEVNDRKLLDNLKEKLNAFRSSLADHPSNIALKDLE